MSLKITFDQTTQPVPYTEKRYTFDVHISGKGVGTQDWMNLVFDECQRAKKLNGVESVSYYHGIRLGMDACQLVVQIKIEKSSRDGTLICPVPEQLFQEIIVAIQETNRIYKKYMKTKKKLEESLAALKQHLLELK